MIVYMLVFFGFVDGCYLVFLLEICKEWGELFLVLGGFFCKFEMILVVLEEIDIVCVCSNVCGEDVYLYCL